MRIVCPNCDAQYEVPDEVIPDEGRDVQCSNCNKTWFQPHPNQPAPEPTAQEAPEEVETDTSTPEQSWEEEFFADGEFDNEFEEDLQDDVTAGPAADIEPEIPANEDVFSEQRATEEETPGPTRKELDPDVEEILREEAARETAARAAEQEPQSLEMQQELGLDDSFSEIDADARAREKAARMAKMRGEGSDDDPEDGANSLGGGATVSALASRRDMLPDIEEINSTLRSTGDRDIAGDDPDPDAPIRNRKRRGFRRGFLWAVLLILIAVLVYAFKAQIAAALPAADPALSAYVLWVDGLREALDTQVQWLLEWLDAKAEASGG